MEALDSTEPTRAQGSLPGAPLRLHEWLYLALVCTLPIEFPFNFRISGLTVQITDLIFVGAVAAWLMMLLKRKTAIRLSKFYLPVTLYSVAMVASTLASVDPRRSALKLLGEFYLVGLSLLTFNLITSKAFLRRTLNAWIIGTGITVAVGTLGVLLFYLGIRDRNINFALHIYGSLPPGNYPRVDALFLYTNMLCNYLNLSLVIVFIMRGAGWLDKTWFRVLSIGISFVALFTFSPGFGGIALGGGLWLWLRLRRTEYRRLGIWVLTGSVVVALMFVAAAAVTLFSYGQGGTTTLVLREGLQPSHRARAWQTAFETFQQHPLLGRGVGMEVSSAVYTNPSGGRERLTDAHNMWFSVAGEKGAIGLLAFVSLLLFLIKTFIPPKLETSSQAVIRTGLAVGFVSALLYQSISGSFENARHLWVFFGIIAATNEMPHKTDTALIL